MEKEIYVIADTHNVEALSILLGKNLSSVLSLGDIAAVDMIGYNAHKEDYSKVWRYYAHHDLNYPDKDIKKWFDDLNIINTKKQLSQIEEGGNNFYLCLGNSDYRMFNWYPELKNLSKTIKNLKVYYQLKTIRFGDNLLIIMPHRTFLTEEVLEEIKDSKEIFLFSHELPQKTNQEFLKKIGKLGKKVSCFHGHIHADNSYYYNLADFPNITFFTPKAEDCEQGFGFNNHLILFNFEDFSFKFLDENLKEIEPIKLPESYLNLEKAEHWNTFN